MKKQLSAIVAFSLIIIHPVISYGGFSDFFKNSGAPSPLTPRIYLKTV
jgi:hypothetical protein